MPEPSLELILAPIRHDLEKVENYLRTFVSSPIDSVNQVAFHIIDSGGKRVRPMLCLLAAALFSKEPVNAVPMASAFELIHTATLLHDDVIDHATLRRGTPSANSLWGNKASILVGDYLYCKASSIIAEQGDCTLLGMIAKATAITTEGEILEITHSQDELLSEENYFKILYHKTAYLMGAALEVGAYLGGASETERENLKNYGIALGMTFQLIDDCLDYISSDDAIGKKVGTDLKEGKLTLPLIHLFKCCNPQEAKNLKQILSSREPSESNLQEVLALMDRYHGMDYTHQKAIEYQKQAQSLLKQYPKNPAQMALMALTDYVVQRKN